MENVAPLGCLLLFCYELVCFGIWQNPDGTMSRVFGGGLWLLDL